MENKKQSTVDEKDITIDMPEVKDIPGQEHVKPPRINEMIDTTVSSAGEEGEGLLDDLNKEPGSEDETILTDSDITPEEEKLLSQTDRPITEETIDLQKLALDKIDDEDIPNETGNPLDMGSDLDIPGSELDDEDEESGEEDEENNSYSNPD